MSVAERLRALAQWNADMCAAICPEECEESGIVLEGHVCQHNTKYSELVSIAEAVEEQARVLRHADWHSPIDSRDRGLLEQVASALAPEEK